MINSKVAHSKYNCDILVVDDDRSILEAINYFLKSMIPGITVKTAFDGLEALQIARKFKPRIILLDIMMPKIDGIELLEIINKYQYFKETRIIVMSGYIEGLSKLQKTQLRVDEFLSKPFNFNSLKSLVERLLSL